MSRLSAALGVYLFGGLGVFLVAVPWTAIWDEATLVFVPTAIGTWIRAGWFRGLVSGLGALDLLVAAHDAGHLWWAGVRPQRAESSRVGDEQP